MATLFPGVTSKMASNHKQTGAVLPYRKNVYDVYSPVPSGRFVFRYLDTIVVSYLLETCFLFDLF